MSRKTLVEKEDKAGIKYFVHEVGDRTYPDYISWHDKDYGECLQAVKNLDMSGCALITTGFPKSGNTWFYEIISMVAEQSASYVPNKMADDFLEHRDLEEILTMTSDAAQPVRVHSHLNPDSLPNQIQEKGTKVIFLVRNLKDVCVSAFHFLKILTSFLPYKGTWENFLDIFLNEPGFFYGLWFDHIKQADLFREEHPGVPVLVMCYEHMKLTPVQEIRKLCHFLEVPDTIAEEIADKVSFKKMRPAVMEGEGKYLEIMDMICEKKSVGLFRKGEIGDWKNTFTVAQSEMVDKLLQDKLGDSPITQLLKPFM